MVSADGQSRTGGVVAIKAQNGSVLCATSTPDKTTSVRSKLDCYTNCVAEGCSCTSGANSTERKRNAARCMLQSRPNSKSFLTAPTMR